MAKRKLSPEEAAEVKSRKVSAAINKQIRDAKGETVDMGIGTPEANVQMSAFIRASTGRHNGRDESDIRAAKRLAVEQGFIINAKGEITHDIRTDAEKAEQEGSE